MRNRDLSRARRERSYFIQGWEDAGDETKEAASQTGSGHAHGQRRGHFSSLVNSETEGRPLNAAARTLDLNLQTRQYVRILWRVC